MPGGANGARVSSTIVAVDLGGTQLRTARFGSGLRLEQRVQGLTRAVEGPQALIARMIAQIRQVLPRDSARVQGIGISAPGPLNPYSGVVLAPPNLPGWRDIPLRDIIAQEFQLPVYLGNDANVAALAEASVGAAQGCRHVLYITVSTGIGSGVISDGMLIEGSGGLAAELGHIPLLLEDGSHTTLEMQAAGPAIARRARQALEAGASSSLRALLCDESSIDAMAVAQAAAQGDALALSCYERAGRILGLGIITALLLFNPERVVIGGGVAKSGDLLFVPMRKTVQEQIFYSSFTRDLQILPAALGGDVGLVGAAALVATSGSKLDIGGLDRRL